MFSILIRHRGFLDRFLREERYHYPEDSINAWVTDDQQKMRRLNTIEEANSVANEFNGRFGSQGYRFDVIEERMVPRWYLVAPRNDEEKRAVGSVGQL